MNFYVSAKMYYRNNQRPPSFTLQRITRISLDTYRKRVYEKTGIHRVRQLQLCVALMRMEQQESETQKES